MQKKEEQENKAIILLKPSGTISISGILNEVQKRIYDVFLLKVQEEITKRKDFYTVKLSYIKKFLNREDLGKDNKYLKEQIKKLVYTKVEYNILKKDLIVDGYTNLITEVEFFRNIIDESIFIRFNIPTRVKQALKNIRKKNKDALFGKINLIIKKNLKGKYSLILFDLLEDYKNVEIPKMAIEQFRKIFGIETKYKTFYDIKKRVLTPAIKEINNNPNIEWKVDYILEKNGNKYTHIKFIKELKKQKKKQKTIKKETQKAITNIKDENKKIIEEVLQAIPQEHRKKIEKIVPEWLEKWEKEYILAQIEYLKEAGNIKNYTGFLIKSLEKDFAEWKSRKEEKKENKEILEKVNKAKKYIGKKVKVYGKEYKIIEIAGPFAMLEGEDKSVYRVPIETIKGIGG